MILKPNHPEQEHSPGADRYLITYADLITLLLGLFVILYAASQVDEERYKELSNAFGQYFKTSEKSVLSGGNGVLEQSRRPAAAGQALVSREKKDLGLIRSRAELSLGQYITTGAISLSRNGSSIIITLPEKLVFSPGQADILDKGRAVLDSLAHILKDCGNQITVDGHTDSDPVRTFRYESNWHLSVSRALNVGYSLIRSGLPENGVIIRGFGSQRPVAGNSSALGRAANRRVEITVSELPADAPSTDGYDRQDGQKKEK